MLKITLKTDCANAPKREYIKDFNVAFAKVETNTILDMMSDDITWTIIGEGEFSGKASVRAGLESMNSPKAEELTIENVLSHGKLGSANGTLVYKDSVVAFNDVYEFENHSKAAKIKSLTSYAIVLDN